MDDVATGAAILVGLVIGAVALSDAHLNSSTTFDAARFGDFFFGVISKSSPSVGSSSLSSSSEERSDLGTGETEGGRPRLSIRAVFAFGRDCGCGAGSSRSERTGFLSLAGFCWLDAEDAFDMELGRGLIGRSTETGVLDVVAIDAASAFEDLATLPPIGGSEGYPYGIGAGSSGFRIFVLSFGSA